MRGRRPVATSSRSPRSSSRLRELEHEFAALAAHGRRVLAEAELDAVGAERLGERSAEWLGLARQHAVRALDERHLTTHPPRRPGPSPHRRGRRPARASAGAPRSAPVASLVGPDALELAQAVDRRDERRRASPEITMSLARVLGTVHGHPSGSFDAAAATENVDALARVTTRPCRSRHSPRP